MKPRHNWTPTEIEALFALPFSELLFRAHSTHREHFDPNRIQLCQLLSIKTGGCPEDCGYCSQSVHAKTPIKASKLMEVETVLAEAKKAKAKGATRYCMGAAWRNPKDRDMEKLEAMIKGVNKLGLETCATLGMLTPAQAQRLKAAGLHYYNHNLDSSEAFYGTIITTRSYQDRLETLDEARKAGLKLCCGGIIGMGEGEQDRASLLSTLAKLDPHPESVPINQLIAIKGTKLEGEARLDPIDFVRTIAVARLVLPHSSIRLSAGREEMSDEMQALCFFAGASSIFIGEQLLTADNPEMTADTKLMKRLGLEAETAAL